MWRMIGSSASMILPGASEDRISHMPEDVIGMILNGMPLRDAVRTSVLSRKWQYHWVMTSELDFGYGFYQSLSIKYKTELQVKYIINKILLLHIGPIRKFTLDFNPYFPLRDDLDYWIHFLSRKGIKEFTLLMFCNDDYQLGKEFYSCLELTYLNIAYCKLNSPATFENFPNLTTLRLYMLSVNGKFANAISACPQLEWVSIEDCNGILNLVVRAPNLKYLRVHRVNGLKSVCLDSTKNLETYCIDLDNKKAPAGVEKLCLGDNILEFSASSSVPKRLTTILVNLKTIFLSCVDFNDVSQVARVLCLIRSSPKLSHLSIEGPYTESALRQDVNFVEDYGDDDCSFGQLKSVRLMLLWGSKAEMAVIKYLLAHSPLLEDMYIRVHNKVGNDKSHSMCKTLMRFARASPKAELAYYDDF